MTPLTPDQEKALALRVLHAHLRHAPSAIDVCVAAHASGAHLSIAQAGPIALYIAHQLEHLDRLLEHPPP